MRLTRAFIPPLVALLALGLAACSTNNPEPTAVPVTNTATPPPVITQIVAPPTPTPLPTLAPQINTALGDWALRITLDVTGWEFADRLSYFGAATLTVDEQGTIEGSGYFSATLDGGACHALVLDEEPLTFQLSGKIDMPGAGTPIPSDSIWGEVRVIPDQRWQPEHFQVLCPDDLGGVREHSAPMLWNLLGAPNMSWPLGFRAGFRNTIEGVAPIPRSGNSATLSGEIVLNRR